MDEITTHKGKMVEVVQKEFERNGVKKTFEFARRSPGVRLIIPQNGSVLLTKEFRHELNKYDYRLPGGKVFDSLDEYNEAINSGADIAEKAKDAAVKEAIEEAGVAVTGLSFVYKSICGSTIVWDLFYFLVNESEQKSQQLEEGEDITTELVLKDEAKKMCLDGRISEERSALVLLRYLEGTLIAEA